MITIPPADDERVAILGGSFNPPHNAHIAICDWLINSGKTERVWIIPCYSHPLGKSLPPFDDRYRMCLFAFEHFGKKVEVSDLEMRLGGKSLTVRTLQYLKQNFPNVKFSLVVGGDIESEKESWYQFEKIKTLAEIITVPRGEESFIPNISGTEIRARIQRGESITEMVSPAVAVYLITKQLYKT